MAGSRKNNRESFSLTTEDISDTELSDISFTFSSVGASEDTKTISNESVISTKRLNETTVKYNAESDSILFAKTPPHEPNNSVSKSAKSVGVGSKRKANDGSSQNCYKRMKTQEQVIASSSSCATVTANSSQKLTENGSIQGHRAPPEPWSKLRTDNNRCKAIGSTSDTRGHQMTSAHRFTENSNNEKRTVSSTNLIRTQSPIATTGCSVSNSARGHGLISTNAYNFGPDTRRVRGTPRPVVIDGSNVAMAHGNNIQFSCRGIQLCAEYFSRRGHRKIVAFVPQYRHKRSESVDTRILDELQKDGILKFTPSREIGKQRFVPYDDR
ncbi:unnamed protein product [Allacma fusca]|uniref:RNase NYN domain-containing protein n=1 Tax=Allacma fusca TaxID=39272 RepID=A0A8J2PVV0_9HEXA|nr:unnamed protein product [Allacma fusca]